MSATVDAVFDIIGERVPADYPFPLWDELQRLMPELATEAAAGVLPLRTAESVSGLLLAKRAKLAVRLPLALATSLLDIAGQTLDIGGETLQIGRGKLREIQPYPTISSHLVSCGDDELQFIDEISASLEHLGIAANLICGRATMLQGRGQSIHGFSLVIHNLKPEDSLRLQYTGLGSNRQHGCGVFIPYKAIT